MHALGQASTDDLDKIHRLDMETYGHDAYSYIILRQLLELAGELFQVCRDDNGDVRAYGVVAPSTSPGSCWLISLVVAVSHRGQGIGTALVSQLLNKAVSYSFEKVYVTVDPHNGAALSLYSRLGFSTARVEHQYFGPGKDRVIMRRQLTQSHIKQAQRG